MKLGIIGSSLKKNEKRVPIHPEHLSKIPLEIRQRLVFEQDYAKRLGWEDAALVALGVGIAPRQELLETLDAVLLLKPMPEDFENLRHGGVHWGWPHCLQQPANTQAAIDRRLTVVAMEQMFMPGEAGERLHPFYKNNEMGGYCAVLHALALKSRDGHYGKKARVLILSFGAVGQGALRALQGRGFSDITVCTQQRSDPARPADLNDCDYHRIQTIDGQLVTVDETGRVAPLLELIAEADIIINAILQDPNRPVMYLNQAEVSRIKPGCLILDISCDEGLGFPFSRPTSFAAPLIEMGHFDYYAVDHTPNYLWECASWEVSQALLPYLPQFLKGPSYWEETPIFRDAIEIKAGEIQNKKILAFQKRAAVYPHAMLASC